MQTNKHYYLSLLTNPSLSAPWLMIINGLNLFSQTRHCDSRTRTQFLEQFRHGIQNGGCSIWENRGTATVYLPSPLPLSVDHK